MLRTRTRPTYAALTAVVVLTLGAAGCDGDAEPSASPTAGSTAGSTGAPTGTPTAPSTPGATSTDGTGLDLKPAAGVPTDFPTTEVPLVPGDFTQPLGDGAGTTAEGLKGWILEVNLAQEPDACFAAASKALTDHGFSKKSDQTMGGIRQGQFAAPGYLVLLSTSPSDSGGCRLGYEVGQVAQ